MLSTTLIKYFDVLDAMLLVGERLTGGVTHEKEYFYLKKERRITRGEGAVADIASILRG